MNLNDTRVLERYSLLKQLYYYINKNNITTIKAYKKELYNIYVGIKSDYIQYQHWKKYNNSLWLFSSYRSKNTKDLSKKIISDIQLFNDGLKMFSMISRN